MSLFEVYKTHIDKLPKTLHTPGGVLYCCVLATITNSANASANANANALPATAIESSQTSNPSNWDVPHATDVITYKTDAGKPGLNTYQIDMYSTCSSLFADPSVVPSDVLAKDVIVCEDNDFIRLQLLASNKEHFQQLPPSPPQNQDVDAREGSEAHIVEHAATPAGLYRFERQAAIRRLFNSMFAGSGALPIEPQASLSERSVKESELLTFSSLSAKDLHSHRQLYAFQDLLQSVMKRLPNFTGLVQSAGNGEDGSVLRRRYLRQLAGLTYSQILSTEAAREPNILKHYYPLTDELLCILYWNCPDRRLETSTWDPSLCCLMAPRQSEGGGAKQKAAAKAKAKAKPVKKGAKGAKQSPAEAEAYEPLSMEELKELRQDGVTITPAGRSIAMVKQFASTGESWLTVHVADCLVGLRVPQQSSILSSGNTVKDRKVDKKSTTVEGNIDEAAASIANEGDSGDGDGEGGGDGATAEDPEGGESGNADTSAVEGDDTTAEKLQAPQQPTVPSATISNSSIIGPGTFFCHTSDDMRFVVTPGCDNAQAFARKPDKCGIVCLTAANLPGGLLVTVSSCGTVRMDNQNLKPSSDGGASAPAESNGLAFSGAIREWSRSVLNGGVVVRHFASSNSMLSADTATSNNQVLPYSKEILCPNGDRILFRNPTYKPKQQFSPGSSGSGSHSGVHSFYSQLVDSPPAADWTYVQLSRDGSVSYCFLPDQLTTSASASSTKHARWSPHPTLTKQTTLTTFVDAETRAVVETFLDGRIIVSHEDGYCEVSFPDGTHMSKHGSGSVLSVSASHLWPSVEVDLDVDSVSFRHARGEQVPINKGGDQVRLRVALPDGSAVLVKYDTKVTAKYNGSLKLVRRDRTVIVASDDGVVHHRPRNSWSEEAHKEFKRECSDVAPKEWPQLKRHLEEAAKFQRPRTTAPTPAPGVTFALTTPGADNNNGNHTKQKGKTKGKPVVTKKSSKVRPAGLLEDDAGSEDDLHRGRRQPSILSQDSSGASISSDVFVATQVLDTKFVFNVHKNTCRIEDYENNLFEVDFKQPLMPTVSLAGEVSGLKPTAVSDSPIDPRIFVVKRNAMATEWLSIQDVSDLENLTSFHPDNFKMVQEAVSQPADLGAEAVHAFYQHIRMLSDVSHRYKFEDVFDKRPWMHVKCPSIAGYVRNFKNLVAPHIYQPKKRSDADSSSSVRVFATRLLTEVLPLSQEGYTKLVRDVSRWDAFCEERKASMDRFAVEDPRSAEDIEEETRVKQRLKQAFKIAKQQAKKREKENAMGDRAVSPSAALGIGGRLEGVEEQADEESQSVMSAPDSDDDKTIDPEELEIRDAFVAFAKAGQIVHVAVPDEQLDILSQPTTRKNSLQSTKLKLPPQQSGTAYPEHLDMQSVRPALVQLLNQAVTYKEIRTAFDYLGLENEDCLFLSDFQLLYRRLRVVLCEPDAVAVQEDAADGGDYNLATDEEKGGPTTTTPSTRRSLSPSFWQSKLGQDSLSEVPPSAPPLDLRPWNWQEGPDNEVDTFQRVPTDPSSKSGGALQPQSAGASLVVPQGSAVQAVRRTKK